MIFRIYLLVAGVLFGLAVIGWTIGAVYLTLRRVWRIVRWCGIKLWIWSVDWRVSRAI
jgi:hypothetical protein